VLTEDAELEKLIEAIVPRSGPLRFSTKAKIKALERASKLGVDISDHLLQVNRRFLQRLTNESVRPTRRSLLLQVTKITGIPARELLSPKRNDAQRVFETHYGKDLLQKIQEVTDNQQKSYPDLEKEPAKYLRFWLTHSVKREVFIAQLGKIFPDLGEDSLLKILAVRKASQNGETVYTPEQELFIKRFGKPLLEEILIRFRHHPTEPRRDKKALRIKQRNQLSSKSMFFRLNSLESILIKTGVQDIEVKALKAFDRVLVEWGRALVKEGLRIAINSQPSRKTLRDKDLELARRFLL
jgi:histone H3/H4